MKAIEEGSVVESTEASSGEAKVGVLNLAPETDAGLMGFCESPELTRELQRIEAEVETERDLERQRELERLREVARFD